MPLRTEPAVPTSDADLVKPEMVKRDDLVTLIYEAILGIRMLTIRGKAIESGAPRATRSFGAQRPDQAERARDRRQRARAASPC